MARTYRAAALILMSACNSNSPQAAADPFVEAREFVVRSLKDPTSAHFGEFRRGKGTAICGQVNARNGFGGYTGLQPLVYDPASPTADRLYIYGGNGDWGDKGIMAEIFDQRGCTIGTEHERALEARRALDESSRRIRDMGEN